VGRERGNDAPIPSPLGRESPLLGRGARGLLHSYRPVLQDCETKLPSWWNGDGQDVAGVKAAIEARRVAVRKPQ
jgi:hypothetical protein